MEHIKQRMEEARKQREQVQAAHDALIAGRRHPSRSAIGAEKHRLFASKKNIWLLSGVAAVTASVMTAWLIGSGQGVTDSFIDSEQEIALPTAYKVPAIRETAHVIETLPPPAAGQTRRETHIASTPRRTSTGENTSSQDTMNIATTVTAEPSPVRKTGTTVFEDSASPAQGTEPVAGGQSSTHESLDTAASKDKEGAWVINLASLSSKADANRLAAKARSKDIETDLQQVTVKGKQYWRVQVTGFSTAAEAAANSGAVKEKLGLKDVWITTR